MRGREKKLDDSFDDDSEMTEDKLSEKFWEEENAPLTNEEIDDQNWHLLKQQRDFRIAAVYVTSALVQFREVKRVVLFGSVAKPLIKEIPRFRKFRRERIAVWHECKDVDIAVWVDDLSCLNELRKASSRALNNMRSEKNIGVAHHQIDMFIVESGTDRYLGNLCKYGTCPKGKRDCDVPGCGEIPFLQVYARFTFHRNALAPDKIIVLYERS